MVALKRLRQEGCCEFEASLSYTGRSYLNKNKIKKTTEKEMDWNSVVVKKLKEDWE